MFDSPTEVLPQRRKPYFVAQALEDGKACLTRKHSSHRERGNEKVCFRVREKEREKMRKFAF